MSAGMPELILSSELTSEIAISEPEIAISEPEIAISEFRSPSSAADQKEGELTATCGRST